MTFISLYEPSWRRVVVCGKFLEIAFQMLLFGKVEFELRKTCEPPNAEITGRTMAQNEADGA